MCSLAQNSGRKGDTLSIDGGCRSGRHCDPRSGDRLSDIAALANDRRFWTFLSIGSNDVLGSTLNGMAPRRRDHHLA
jgi:hypothetical protein